MQIKGLVSSVSSFVKLVNRVAKSDELNMAVKDSQSVSELVGKFVQIALTKVSG